MKNSWILALQISFIGFAPHAFCQTPVDQTTALLNDPDARAKVIQAEPTAKDADDQVKALGLGAAGEAKVYELSGQIMQKMAADNGGDPEKMAAQVQRISRDPASLENMMTDDQKTEIHILAIEKEK